MVPLLISEKCGNFSDSYESEEEMQEVSNRPKKKFKPPVTRLNMQSLNRIN